MTQAFPQPKTSGLAVASLVCGILSFFCFGPLTAVPAIIMGHMSLRRIRNNPLEVGGHGMALAGTIMGYVGLVVGLVFMSFFAAIAVPNFIRARERAQATALVNDIRMLQSAAETYAIEKELQEGQTVKFSDMNAERYFKEGSKIQQGQSAKQLPPELEFDVYFEENPIDPTRPLEVPMEYRKLFEPTIKTNDSIWER